MSSTLTASTRSVKPPGGRSAWSQLSGMDRIFYLIKVPLRALLCLSNITVFFLAYFGMMLPIMWARKLWPRLYWFYEGKLYRWLQAFIGYWGYTAGYDVYEYGDDISICARERVLLMCNHQSTADVPTLMTILQKRSIASRKVEASPPQLSRALTAPLPLQTLWLMDVMFRLTPFGIVGRMHGDYFIQQGKATRDKELHRLQLHLRDVFWDRDRRWVILFPEGGFFYKRVDSSQQYGKDNGFPYLKHTTLPRMGAVKVILEEIGPREEDDGNGDGFVRTKSGKRLELIKDTIDAIREKKYIKETRPPIKWILDMTIAYPHGIPLGLDTLALGTREKCDIAVNYKLFKADEVPFRDDVKLRDWMYARYVEKDAILDHYYKEGVFHKGEEGQRVHFSWWKIIGQYVFWFSSFYVQYRICWWLVQQAWTLGATLIHGTQ